MNSHKTNVLTVETPEGITFSLKLAGPVTRFLAWAIDCMAILAMGTVINKGLAAFGIISHDVASALSIFFYFIVSIGYGILLEWRWQGKTIGKRLLRLKVMDVSGLRLEFSQVVVRNLLRCVDSLPGFYMIGGLACLFSAKAQRLGDIAANTIVVWTPRVAEPALDNILAGKFNSFDDYPHLNARLRQRISPAEAGIALQALLRREELNPAARVELFREMADHFKKAVPFPQEATDGLSNEQYLRNVVDILYQK